MIAAIDPAPDTTGVIDVGRAALSIDGTGTMATFSGFIPVTSDTREVEIVAWGADRVPTSEIFAVEPGMLPAGPAEFGTFADATDRQRWAVIIGISDYADPEITDLDYADDDARALYDFLRSDAAGLQGIPEENIRLLVNEQATQRAIRSALLTFLRRSDHGARRHPVRALTGRRRTRQGQPAGE